MLGHVLQAFIPMQRLFGLVRRDGASGNGRADPLNDLHRAADLRCQSVDYAVRCAMSASSVACFTITRRHQLDGEFLTSNLWRSWSVQVRRHHCAGTTW